MPREAGPRPDRRSGRWVAQVGAPSARTGRRARVILRYEDGRPVRIDDRGGAHAAFARLLAAREAEAARAAGPSVADVIVAYIRWHEARGSKASTIETHRWHLTRFGEFAWGGLAYEDRPASSIGVADWTRFRRDMEAHGAQTGYVRLAYASVAACWHWAARPVEEREPERLIAADPFAGLARPRKGRGRRLVLPWATIARLVEFAADWAERPTEGLPRNQRVAIHRQREANRLKALALRLIAETGCRPIEAATLRREWVLPAERAIVIPAEAIKTGKERIIPLGPGMADALAGAQAAGLSHDVWVFAPAGEPRDEPPDPHKLAEWFRGVRREARKAGIVLPPGTSLYTLRHSLVSQARAAGIDLRTLAPMMGHSAAVAEDVYYHAQIVEVRAIGDRVRALREGGSGAAGETLADGHAAGGDG